MSNDENPYTRMIIREKVSNLLGTLPREILSDRDKAIFSKITGLTQNRLERNWAGKDGIRGTEDDGRLTSCNSFVGWYSRMIIPANKHRGGHFLCLT